jgi:LmeA-like phospholipid-binding
LNPPPSSLAKSSTCAKGVINVESHFILKTKTSRIISTVLSPALRLWLRSQVERIAALEFKITGSDRQILTGNIPAITIAASHAVYRGLHLGEIQLEATQIQVNLSQVIKGKSLHLLAPVPVTGQLVLSETDLQASLESPLLATALSEFLVSLLTLPRPDPTNESLNFSWQKIAIEQDLLTLTGTLQAKPLVIKAGLQLASPHELLLNPFQIQMSSDLESQNLDNYQVDLGSEVALQEISLTPGQLLCRGGLKVLP